MDNIFVSIAAWEDSHLIDAMRKFINTADNPNSIVFGLGLNYEIEPDFSEFINNNIKIVRDKEVGDGSPGIIGIREAIRNLITDEEYFMGVDAHVDLERGWDTKLKNDINELTKNDEKIIMSRQATAAIFGKKNYATAWSLRGDIIEFGLDGYVIEVNEEYLKEKMVNDKYFKNYYVSCNFIFAKVKDIKNIIFPSYHKFPFEEPEQSLAIYCQGYDVVSPIAEEICHYAGNDIKYMFDSEKGYDTRFWKLSGNDPTIKNNWKKIWVEDDDDMRLEVKKLMIFGENKYYSVNNNKRTIRDFYQQIGQLDNYEKILYDGLSRQYMYGKGDSNGV